MTILETILQIYMYDESVTIYSFNCIITLKTAIRITKTKIKATNFFDESISNWIIIIAKYNGFNQIY